MKKAEIVNKPFSAEIGDGFCDKWSDVAYCDDLDRELIERCRQWKDAQDAKKAGKAAKGFSFGIMAAALKNRGSK